jgi:hypothetical protein
MQHYKIGFESVNKLNCLRIASILSCRKKRNETSDSMNKLISSSAEQLSIV